MHTSLLGLLLICYSSRGHQLVFSYPRNPKKSAPRSTYPSHRAGRTHAGGLELDGVLELDWDDGEWERVRNGVPNTAKPRNDGTGGDTRAGQGDEFLGFDPQFLSDILSPKVALCDRRFQLTVDDVTFVGHPTLLNADRPGTGHRFARVIQKKRLTDLAELASAAVKDPSSLASSKKDLASSDASRFGLSSLGVGGPAAVTPIGPDGGTHQLTMFNLVFAMQPQGGSNFNKQVEAMYNHVLVKVTAGLKYEQLRRGYVRREAELIMSIKDDAQSKSSARIRMADVMERTLAESSLARVLAHIYHSITTNLMAHVVIDSSLDLSLQIPASVTRQSIYPEAASIEDEEVDNPTLRPYHALLLLYDPEEILKSLPLDPSPLLVELIQIVTPTQSFEELQTTLDCSLSQIYRHAAHLVHWRKAKIIHVISTRNVYVASPNVDTNLLPYLVDDFNNRFPQLELTSVLSDLFTPRPYANVMPSKDHRTLYLEVITYLLRHGLVVQVHIYVYLVIPDYIRRKIPGLGSSAIGSTTSADQSFPPLPEEPIIVPDPEQASDLEREWIAMVANTQPQPVASLFLRLVRYFAGKLHVEEIVFRENITRKDLKTILSRYREFLITTLYPDP
ncbi:Nitrogen permease regulator 3 [Borealophlyctis nickersoniae]|nr:Nitrogen permease regulator 3 [Borealophlyctis nickersoniae]